MYKRDMLFVYVYAEIGPVFITNICYRFAIGKLTFTD